MGQILQLLIFVNKAELEGSHTYPFMDCLWSLCATAAELAVVTETLWPAKPEIYTIWTSTQKVYQPLLQTTADALS